MNQQPVILIVDDEPSNLGALSAALSDEYTVRVSNSGSRALEIVQTPPAPDLILLDVMMPEMDGYSVLAQLKQNPESASTPVIFVTALDGEEDEEKGLAMGAVDYITKPIQPAIVKARTRTHLALKEARDLLEDQNRLLEDKVRERTQQIRELQEVTIHTMASMAELRDLETENHIHRTQRYVRAMAEKLKQYPKYRDEFPPSKIEALFHATALHDIGKVGVPDHILTKSGKLTPAEFREMSYHTTYGHEIITGAENNLAREDEFLTCAKEIAYGHHERWDGSGYPRQLKGEQIPLSARLMIIADTYDSLISAKLYKPPYSHEAALAVIKEGRGAHFDPEIAEVFLEIEQKIKEISEQFHDNKSTSFYAL